MGNAAEITLSCIIPAYNEAHRIGRVLQVVIGHPLIDEVIVIDDASGDETADVVKGFSGVTLIKKARNGGKTRAVQTGIRAARGRFLLLLDADLSGLASADITALATPVLGGRADMSISLRQNAPRLWKWIGLDYISGERVLRREVLAANLEALSDLPNFGLEVYMNAIVIRQNFRLAVVSWPSVQSPYKNRKYGFCQGVIADIRMLRDIFKTITPVQILRQIVRMRRQRIAR